ncbi:MAG: phage portal protein [Tissierellia bacterium]|nr:phage portal protein [Tissierellia bacterium]
MFRTNKDTLEASDVKEFIEEHKKLVPRYQILQKYYEGKHKILNKKKVGTAPCNNLVNPFPKYITDMLTGYLVGQPALYSAVDNDSEEDDDFLIELMNIFRFNNEQEVNLEIAKSFSIKGEVLEHLWSNEDGNIRFKPMQPDEAFLIYDNTLEDEVKFAIRYFTLKEDGEDVLYAYVYDKHNIFIFNDKLGQLSLSEIDDHSFQEVPFILYENNKEHLGDFETVMSLVDAYDLAQSNTLNDMEQFTDAYLVLINMGGTDDDDVDNMKKKRTMLVDGDGDAKWLIKDVNDAWVENYKNRIKKDIHKFSGTPDMSDETFGSSLSGVSLRYKLLAMEQIRANKERKFKKGLFRRIELISNFLGITNQELTFTGIDIQFNSTLPQNVLEIAQVINLLRPILPDETLIEQLYFVDNAKEEMKKKRIELEDELGSYPDFFNSMKADDEDGEEKV